MENLKKKLLGLNELEKENLKEFIDDYDMFDNFEDLVNDLVKSNQFIFISENEKQAYNSYVEFEKGFIHDWHTIRSFEDFKNALSLDYDDRSYTEINRYIKLSNGVYYINDNTLLG